jgi:hypothetical protein
VKMATSSPDLAEVPEEHWQEARRRFEIVQQLAGTPDRTRASVQVTTRQLQLSVPHAYRLLERYTADPRLTSLLPARRGRRQGQHRLAAMVEEVIQVAIEEVYLRSSCSARPQSAKWDRGQSLAEGKHVFAVVQDDSAVEAGTQQFPQPFETAEVSFSDGARCLHLYAGVVRLRLTPLASTSLSPIGRGAIIRVAQPPCQFSVERRQCCGRV